MRYNEVIKKLLDEQGISQRKMARRLGLYSNAVNIQISGTLGGKDGTPKDITLDQLIRYMNELGYAVIVAPKGAPKVHGAMELTPMKG